jgi:WhiB family redox-sensing transcriptional regulator
VLVKGRPREIGLPMPWKEDGLCWNMAGQAGNWMDVPSMPSAAQRSAKSTEIAICRQCPVRKECLNYALRTNQPSGIWGGLIPRDRAKLRKRRAA